MKLTFKIIFLILISSCSSNTLESSFENTEHQTTTSKISWYVDKSGLIGKFEPFPEIDSISFHNNLPTTDIHDKHRVAILNMNGNNFAFLYGDLGYYESLNFKIYNKNYAITHCPITNTTIAFELENSHKIRASGYRLKDNLVFYNSITGDFISQMLQQTIGSRNHTPPYQNKTIPILDTEWNYAKSLNNLKIAKVNDLDLGDYNLATQYNANELQLNNMSISFNIDVLKKETDIIELKDKEDYFIIKLDNYLVIGNKVLKTINVFSSDIEVSLSDSKNYLTDNNNNKYDYTGYCFSGNKIGQSLFKINSYIGSTHAFETLFNIVYKK